MATIDRALDEAKKFIQRLSTLSTSSFTGAGLLFSHAGLGSIGLDGEELAGYRQGLANLHKATLRHGGLSSKTIEHSFQNAILVALDPVGQQQAVKFSDRLTTAIRDLRTTLLTPLEPWHVHLPIRGLALTGLPRRFGRVKFEAGTPTLLARWRRETNWILDRTLDSPAAKGQMKRLFNDDLQKSFSETAVASIVVQAADDEAAKALARAEVRSTLDVMNFFSDLVDNPGLNAFVYLLGDRESTTQTSLVVRKRKNFALPKGRVGTLKPVLMSEFFDRNAMKYGAPKVSKWMASLQRDSYQERVLSAMQLAGRATAAIRPDEAFLFYCIALESVIGGPQSGENIGYRLRVRCGHLLGKSLVARQRIARQLSRLYGVRSKFVHAGVTAIDPDDVETARRLAKSCIVRLLTRSGSRFRTSEALDEWFEARVMR